MANEEYNLGHGHGCNCLGSIKLKIEQEVDALKGEFRKKENELINPLLSRIAKLEREMQEFRAGIDRKNAELEKIMISQEDTVGFILNSLQNLTSMINSTQIASSR